MFVFASFSVLMFGCLRDSRALTWLRWSCAGLLSLLLVLDLVCPLPLPASQDMAMLVVARDGTPLRAFLMLAVYGATRRCWRRCRRCTCRPC